jgi:hypothetical protein
MTEYLAGCLPLFLNDSGKGTEDLMAFDVLQCIHIWPLFEVVERLCPEHCLMKSDSHEIRCMPHFDASETQFN